MPKADKKKFIKVCGMWECLFLCDYLIWDLVKWDYKEKREAINKIYRTNLPDKHNGDKDNEQTCSVTLTEGLSRNHMRTRTLWLMRVQIRGSRILERFSGTVPGEEAMCRGRELGRDKIWLDTKGANHVNCGQSLHLSGCAWSLQSVLFY